VVGLVGITEDNMKEKLNGYYLTKNMLFNCKHVVKRRWYHFIIGQPDLTIDYVEAANKDIARKKFKLKGHHFGLLHDY
jgi:hypothetical protein